MYHDPKIKYPVCIDGARACPPEDCGGIYGYENVLTVLSDPENDINSLLNNVNMSLL